MIDNTFNLLDMESKESKKSWVDLLDAEDLNFLKQFILSSGSLKDLAQKYEVSYPTMRLRVDRLIEKIKLLDALHNTSTFEVILRTEFAQGKLSSDVFHKLLAAYQAESSQK